MTTYKHLTWQFNLMSFYFPVDNTDRDAMCLKFHHFTCSYKSHFYCVIIFPPIRVYVLLLETVGNVQDL